MNINNILRNLFVIILAGYISLAIGDDTVREQYTVKINSISMTRDVAESILRIISNNNRISVVAYDNVKNTSIVLSVVEKNMDVCIDDVFVAKILKLYNNCLDENTSALFVSKDRKCMLYKFEDGSKINMCIDKKDKTIIVLGIIE